MDTREPTHAGSWYTGNGATLTRELDEWLGKVPAELEGVGSLPQPGARIVIAPHAGYRYSGACAAWAYKALDLSKAKRIFLIHPSHHHPLSTVALPVLKRYATPLSSEPLNLDTALIDAFLKSPIQSASSSSSRPLKFTTMSPDIDEAEHSGEMQLPYIHRLLQLQYPGQPAASYPLLVPMMVGSTSPATEKAFGKFLAPYLADEENAFVISSDFCHWGGHFRYAYYIPTAPTPAPKLPISTPDLPHPNDVSAATDNMRALCSGHSLRSRDKIPKPPTGPYAHESISFMDIGCMAAISTGSYDQFQDALEGTGNTICGRHPIGVVMAGLEEAMRNGEGPGTKGKFTFVRYERSADVISPVDSSVSYVSAIATM